MWDEVEVGFVSARSLPIASMIAPPIHKHEVSAGRALAKDLSEFFSADTGAKDSPQAKYDLHAGGLHCGGVESHELACLEEVVVHEALFSAPSAQCSPQHRGTD